MIIRLEPVTRARRIHVGNGEAFVRAPAAVRLVDDGMFITQGRTRALVVFRVELVIPPGLEPGRRIRAIGFDCKLAIGRNR